MVRLDIGATGARLVPQIPKGPAVQNSYFLKLLFIIGITL